MHLQTLIAFGVVFLKSDQKLGLPLFGPQERVWTLSLLGAQALVVVLTSLWSSRAALRTLANNRERPHLAVQFHHRVTGALRIFVIAAFAFDMFATRWADICYSPGYPPWLRIIGDFCALLPYGLGVVAIWWLAYPVDSAFREGVSEIGVVGPPEAEESRPISPTAKAMGHPSPTAKAMGHTWSRREYLTFNIRHHILIVGVPITLILYVSNLTRGYGSEIRELAFGWPYAPDVLLGTVALGVFVTAPVLLRHIWTTEPLGAGPLRQRLEQLCDRIGLRRRDILVWKSGGMMVNAAVMGLAPRVRFVLLSDALLETMSELQVEAVFGHEAGHVRHHHIEFFLLFAFVAMLAVSGMMEWLARTSPQLDFATIQAVGGVATLLLWGVGFGWISRRFERQADLFGALCVTPEAAECTVPCSVHPEPQALACPMSPVPPERGTGGECGAGIFPVKASRVHLDAPYRGASRCTLPWRQKDPRVCATAAASFISALDRVAVLNGIPHEERSWRHSSIANRMRFLTSLANDPARAARFERVVRRIKTVLLVSAVVGAGLASYYYLDH